MDWLIVSFQDSAGNAVVNSMTYLADNVYNIFNTDMTVFANLFPIAISAYEVIKIFALSIMFMILIFGLVKNFVHPNVSESEPPMQLLLRCAIAMVAIFYASEIINLALTFFKMPYTMLAEAPLQIMMSPDELQEYTDIAAGAQAGDTGSSVGALLSKTFENTLQGMGWNPITVIVVIMVWWNYFKLSLEAIERYIVLGLMSFTSPLGFAMLASKNTMEIFKAWVRMLFSQCLLMFFNLWFLKGFETALFRMGLSGLAIFGNETANKQMDAFTYWLTLLAFLKIGQKVDTYLNTLGLNTAHTGGMLAMEVGAGIAGVGRAITSTSNAIRGGANIVNNASSGGTAKTSGFGNTVSMGGMTAPSGMSEQGKTLMGVNSNAPNQNANFADSVGKYSGKPLSPQDTGILAGSKNTNVLTGASAINSAQGLLAQPFGAHNIDGKNNQLSNVEIGNGGIRGEVTTANPNGTSDKTAFSARPLGANELPKYGESTTFGTDGNRYAISAQGPVANNVVHGEQELIASHNNGTAVFSDGFGNTLQGTIQSEGGGQLSHTYTDASGAEQTEILVPATPNMQNVQNYVRGSNEMEYAVLSQEVADSGAYKVETYKNTPPTTINNGNFNNNITKK